MIALPEAIPEALRPLIHQALPVWLAGGWAMAPLAAIGLIMYTLGISSLFQLLLLGARASPDRAWRRWKRRPDRTWGPIGRIIAEAMSCSTLQEIRVFFQLLVCEGVNPFARRLQIMKVCVACAPLLGLLGTVTGMLTTFDGLARGGGGDQTMAIISRGISEALITTKTGLVVALTGMMILFFLTRQQQRYQKVVAHMETLCMLEFQRQRSTAPGPERKGEQV